MFCARTIPYFSGFTGKPGGGEKNLSHHPPARAGLGSGSSKEPKFFSNEQKFFETTDEAASLSPFKPRSSAAKPYCTERGPTMPTEDPQQRLLLEDRRAQHGGVFGRALPQGSSTGAAVDDMSGAEGLFGCAFHEGLDEARAVGRGLGPRDEPPPQLHSVAWGCPLF